MSGDDFHALHAMWGASATRRENPSRVSRLLRTETPPGDVPFLLQRCSTLEQAPGLSPMLRVLRKGAPNAR